MPHVIADLRTDEGNICLKESNSLIREGIWVLHQFKFSSFIEMMLYFKEFCIRSDNQPVGKLCFWEAARKPLCKGKGRKMTYEKLILSDLPDMELQEILTAARNRGEGKNATKLN